MSAPRKRKGKRFLIHKIRVKRVGGKIQFQIKLPDSIKKIKAIKITTNG